MTSNADIVAAARGWLGTRFHHQGRLKKNAAHNGGVDCLGLLVGVAHELDLRQADDTPIAALDRTDYGHYPNPNHLREQLDNTLNPIPIPGISPGDILLLRIDTLPQHLAIASDLPLGLGIIHAYAPARSVVEHLIDESWRQRIAAAYRFF